MTRRPAFLALAAAAALSFMTLTASANDRFVSAGAGWASGFGDTFSASAGPGRAEGFADSEGFARLRVEPQGGMQFDGRTLNSSGALTEGNGVSAGRATGAFSGFAGTVAFGRRSTGN